MSIILLTIDGDECVLINGTMGVCRADKDCQWLKESLQSGAISFSNIVRCSLSVSLVVMHWIYFYFLEIRSTMISVMNLLFAAPAHDDRWMNWMHDRS